MARAQRIEAAAEWISKCDIATALATHSRGVDRADENLLASAYHPDAAVDYGFFAGSALQLATILSGAQKAGPVTLHRTSNMWIKVKGEQARSESYVIAYAETREPKPVQRFIGGRYLDEHARRAGDWRLCHRRYVMDFNINRDSTTQWADPPLALASFAPRGGHGAADTGRALLAQYAAAFDTKKSGGMMTTPTDDELDGALSKQALHELNMAYARAIDRADLALMRSLFRADSTVVSGVFNGSGPDYAEHIIGFVRDKLERCFHSVANEWYQVSGDAAVGEAYVIANVTVGGRDILTGGRYVDAFERRDGVWKIKARSFVLDWSNAQPSSYEADGMYASLKTRGCYGDQDPVYAFWNR